MARKARKGRPVDGILILDKPVGISSNRALQTVKRLFNAQKAGHTGSLDPLATGMLPLCFGEATKVSAFLLDSDKTYITEARLGIKTSTGDREGEIIHERPVADFGEAEILKTLKRFTGSIKQIPPMHSALKKDGKPLYKLARKGLDVERESRPVTVYAIDLLEIKLPVLVLRVHCSKGTYIRTLVEDIGEALGCGAHVQRLHRESTEPFGKEKMYSIEELGVLADQGTDALDRCLLRPDTALTGMPEIELNQAQKAFFQAGRMISDGNISADMQDRLLRVYDVNREFLGLALVSGDGQLCPKRVFGLQTI
ncbi:MAG: tRNA pseudouridine(55) synthase TruB [Gammaproteobacteria bacterium]|nr:tRNA pseudouridine(55) synthase TruB [Gammaproteobacteria bacterium]